MSPTLFACGSNGSGQLAIGHSSDVSTFTPCLFDQSCPSSASEVVDLVSAASHVLVLVRDPSSNVTALLGAGTNTHGQLGLQCSLKDCQPKAATSFRPLTLARDAGLDQDLWSPTRIAATWTTSFVVYERTSSGIGKAETVIVASGSNDFGELSVPPHSREGPVLVSLSLQSGEWIEHLKGGQRHVIAVISRGYGQGRTQRLIGWGACRRGELEPRVTTNGPASCDTPKDAGRGKRKGKALARPATSGPIDIPLVMPPGSSIVDLALGATHSIALLSDGRVLAWGSDLKGQITGLETATGVSAVGATWGGTYLLASPASVSDCGPRAEDCILTQGSNTHGQLLRSSDSHANASRARAPLKSTPTTLVTGSEHVLVLCRDSLGAQSFWAGGWNEHGNLALGDDVDRDVLTRVSMPRFEAGGHCRAWAGCAASWVAYT